MAGCAYVLLNPLLGVIEPIPDILPLIGNLDDVGAVYVIWKLWPRFMDAINDFVAPEPNNPLNCRRRRLILMYFNLFLLT